MVANEVCRMPTSTSSTIALFVSKSFLSRYLFNKDGEGPMELLKGKKLNQTLLKFTPLCSPSICNLIVLLKHRFNNLGSLDYILKLKALCNYDYIQNNYFPGQQVG
jgi:hypothetical protein